MEFIKSILRGVGQVMFQNNIYSGTLFLIGIFYNSWLLGIAALFGTIISTVSAHVLKYSKDDIKNGLYGFNGTLTGIAIFLFFEVNLTTLFALILGTVLSTLIMKLLKRVIPPFTAPFVLATWFVIYSLLFILDFTLLTSSKTTENIIPFLSGISNSFGQVMFQENVITGIFFLLAIFINNKLMAMYALYAAVLGSLTGWLFLESISAVNAGLMGYNAILCAIALSGKKWSDFLWITTAIILSTFLNIGLSATGLITLTAPFVIATWIVLQLMKIKKLKLEKV